MRQKLGQHFLCDPSVVDAILKLANLSPQDRVLEIGPGRGVMTYPMASKVSRLVAYEVDPVLARKLRSEFEQAPETNVEIIEQDFLKADLPAQLGLGVGVGPYKVVANLPYYITSPILERLLLAPLGLFSEMWLMMQHEVAKRIVSPARRECGSLTYFCHYYSQPEYVLHVPPTAFAPPPEVDSAVVHFKMRSEPLLADPKRYFQVVRQSFAARRKMLKKSLAGIVTLEQFEKAAIEPTLRPENLSLEDFLRLAQTL